MEDFETIPLSKGDVRLVAYVDSWFPLLVPGLMATANVARSIVLPFGIAAVIIGLVGTARAHRIALIATRDVLELRNHWKTRVLSWDQVAAFRDGSRRVGGELRWALQVVRTDGSGVRSDASVSGVQAGSEMIRLLAAMASRHGIESALTGFPRT